VISGSLQCVAATDGSNVTLVSPGLGLALPEYTDSRRILDCDLRYC